MDYGINNQSLPVIVVYPDFREKSDIIECSKKEIRHQVKNLWDKLPIFRDSKYQVPTLHIPNNKELIKKALLNTDFMVGSKGKASDHFYPC